MEQDGIQLFTYSKLIRKRFWAISTFTLILTLVGALITFFYIPPVYEARVQMLVNQTTGEEGAAVIGDVNNQLKLVKTYGELIESPRIMGPAAEEAPGVKSQRELKEKVRVETQTDSQVLTIVVRGDNTEEAASTADIIADTFKNEIPDLVGVDNVQVLSKALADPKPVQPQPLLYIGLTLIFSLILSTVFVFLQEIWRQESKKESGS
ncbi:YveK family protein [Bacillus songklensis]|uniref:YveK family protein n=1 Tax=Bacillus songklensis TaxID=1069116 RepID=A0ABV8B2V3_9BACI